MLITGECFCGSVQYEIRGSLKEGRSCHCSCCRKAFSAQASAYALVDAEKFKWQRGETLLTEYKSKSGFGLRFCSLCGSTLCGIYNGRIHGVSLGCINGNPDVELGYHQYVGSKATWEVMPEHVTVFEEQAPGKI